MNLTTVLVTLAIAGSATPGIAKMALQPIIAQKRATNFGVAEMQAVTFAAKNEGKTSITRTPDQCQLKDLGDKAYEISCRVGQGTYQQVAARSFRLLPDNNGSSNGGNNSSARSFPHPTPLEFSTHQCRSEDAFGVIEWKRIYPTLAMCTPQVVRTKQQYLASNPDDWMYDINGFNGYGPHPDY